MKKETFNEDSPITLIDEIKGFDSLQPYKKR